LAGPDVGGSMGGQDPEKYGPIRSLLKYYSTKPHIFRSCVKDNRKRFGPRVNNVCAWVKDQIKGTTYWRGKESELRGMMLEEGMTEADIQIVIYDTEWGQEVEYPPSREMAEQMCENCGVDYDPDGFDEACPSCGEWDDCGCDEMHKAIENHKARVFMKVTLTEAKQTKPKPMYPSGSTDADKKQIMKGITDADKEASDAGKAGSPKSKSGKKGPKNPREVARPENGTIVYDDGSIKDTRTGLSKFPVHVYQDGSVRYDDGSVARPGSLASLLILQPMSKEDRARLFAAGPAGLALKDFASVDELINSVTKQAYSKAGVGGMGELAVDPLAQQQSMQGALDAASMSMIAQQSAGNLPKTNVNSPGLSAASPSVNSDENNMPLKPRRGESIVRGPQGGGRGVWRTVDKTPVFIKIGQTPNQAREERRARAEAKK
jgi:hypothetical protein